jgi:hypothetical protein
MEAEAAPVCAPVCAPVTADTRRHAATSDDRESGAERHLAMASDTTRHAGLGLQNRRLPVRFLSHPPLPRLNSCGLRLHGVQPVLRTLTHLTPTGVTWAVKKSMPRLR